MRVMGVVVGLIVLKNLLLLTYFSTRRAERRTGR